MYESQAYNELPLGPTSSIVAPSHIPGLPPVAPHHPLVIRLPELAELAHKVVDVLVRQASRVRVGNRALHERIRARFGQVVLRGRRVPEPHEQELRVEALQRGWIARRNFMIWHEHAV